MMRVVDEWQRYLAAHPTSKDNWGEQWSHRLNLFARAFSPQEIRALVRSCPTLGAADNVSVPAKHLIAETLLVLCAERLRDRTALIELLGNCCPRNVGLLLTEHYVALSAPGPHPVLCLVEAYFSAQDAISKKAIIAALRTAFRGLAPPIRDDATFAHACVLWYLANHWDYKVASFYEWGLLYEKRPLFIPKDVVKQSPALHPPGRGRGVGPRARSPTTIGTGMRGADR